MDKSNNNVINGLVHISLLFFSIIVPLILYFVSEDEDVKVHAKEALNVGLNMLIVGAVSGVASVVIGFLTFGIGSILIAPLIFIYGAVFVVFIIIAGVKAFQGEFYTYPMTFRIIK